MKEFTYGELKQGLLCCTVYKDCKNCPFFTEATEWSCTDQLLSAALNCINTMERDLAEVRTLAGRWEETATAHEQEIFRLNESLDKK